MTHAIRIDTKTLAAIETEAKSYLGTDIFYPKDAIYRNFVETLRLAIPWQDICQSEAYLEFSKNLKHPVEGWLPPYPSAVSELSTEDLLLRLAHHFANEKQYRGNLNTAGKSGSLVAAITKIGKHK